MNYENFKTLARTIEINGQVIDVQVTIKTGEDDLEPEGDFDFGDTEENAAYLKRFRSGELFIGIVLVEARALGEIGFDSLGGCHWHTARSKFETDVQETIDAHDLVESALAELKSNIINKANQLKRYASELQT